VRLILASASPRRAELLTSAGFTFEVHPANVDETPRPGESPKEYALRVATDKVRAVAGGCGKPGSVVLAADTVVVAGTQILGKPTDRADAEQMLRALSGRVHEVHTAVVIRREQQEASDIVTTRVRFLSLSPAEIAWYLESGEAEGKAGAYAIQGRAARFVDWIDGSWSNVVGLPLATVSVLLKQHGEVD
jgi:septum formation protein